MLCNKQNSARASAWCAKNKRDMDYCCTYSIGKASLLQSTIMVNHKKVKIYDNNPYDLKAKRVEGERVVFKDLPLWESETLIKDYLKSLEQVGNFPKFSHQSSRPQYK